MLKRVRICLFSSLIGLAFLGHAQVNPQEVTIVRDSFGVPHIHAPTDAALAYGLAWAHAEDDFPTIQDQLLVVRSRSAEVNGKASAPADVVVKMLGFSELVSDEAYQTQLSPEFRKVLDGYVQGINRYAKLHPAEVKLKGLFPVSGKDLVSGYLLGLALLTQTPNVIGDILDGKIGADQLPQSSGSNVMTVAPSKTGGEGTFLAINSHQPLEGLYSWYEAHLVSDEGTNILGATFPGGVSIFLGSNQHLGWSHTVNYADFNDVYRLHTDETHPAQYRVDGKWLPLKERKAKIKVKIFGPLKVPVSRTYFETMFGPAFETPNGTFALSFAASRAIKAPEQWWRMGKAENLQEFQSALRMQGITGTNIMYADKAGNIYYLGNASLPPRKRGYDWSRVLPGDDSDLCWSDSFVPIDSLAWYLNPSSGYLFNTNNTPFHATGQGYNREPETISANLGYRTRDNNRAKRIAHLFEQKANITWKEFKQIKYDRCYPDPLYAIDLGNLEGLLQLDPAEYPEISKAINILNAWDRCTQPESKGAALFVLSQKELYRNLRKQNRLSASQQANESDFAAAIESASKYLQTHYGRLDPAWGEVQRHRRGGVDLPLGGGPDILAASYGQVQADHRLRVTHGETYIQLVRWDMEGNIHLESISPYGASARPESPHYTDQMQRYVDQQTKVMSLVWDNVKTKAERIYHPD